MAVYLIANVKVTDGAWIPDYAANVHDIVHKHGGEYLSRSANITSLEGDAPDTTLIAILKFPSMDAAQSFASDRIMPPMAKLAAQAAKASFTSLMIPMSPDQFRTWQKPQNKKAQAAMAAMTASNE